jgi:hypothetical protein
MLSQPFARNYHGPGVQRPWSPSKLTFAPPACGMHPRSNRDSCCEQYVECYATNLFGGMGRVRRACAVARLQARTRLEFMV